MKLSEKILNDLAPYHLLKHPFYVSWMKGELTQSQLKNYAIQYYPHVLAFPRYVSAVHAQCEDETSRRDLAMNIMDEEGLIEGRESHPELWLKFCENVGATREEVRSASIAPDAKAMCDGFTDLSRASYAEGLASFFAYEYQTPEIAQTKIDGLKDHYGVTTEAGVKFFEVHKEADVLHTESCKAALDRIPASEHEAARTSAVKSAKLLWNFLSEAYAAA